MIIGLGTGRCGTVSLSKLLQRCNLKVTHEFPPSLEWQDGNIANRVKHMERHNLDGDVSFWYINYIDYLNKWYGKNNVKFVCLERSVDEVVKSYINKTQGRNHWMNHDGVRWRCDQYWDKCFPKYDVAEKDSSIELYCNNYNKLATKYDSTMSNFKIFNMNLLNTEEGVKSILEFLDINNNVSKDLVNIQTNKTL
jgi:hypothetical protein